MGVASETSVSFLRSAADPNFHVPGSALNTFAADDADKEVNETAICPEERVRRALSRIAALWVDVTKPTIYSATRRSWACLVNGMTFESCLPIGGNPVSKPEKMQM